MVEPVISVPGVPRETVAAGTLAALNIGQVAMMMTEANEGNEDARPFVSFVTFCSMNSLP
ncbi:hypothetical protein GC176_10195 [bacterium]|nr:hypothetical protein [bacterium]